jgi:hypothetical protein
MTEKQRFEIQIPDSITIGAIPIQIKHGKKWDKRCNEERRYGAFFGDIENGRTIYMHSKQQPADLSSTFIHELLEAIRGTHDMQITHTNVCTLANGLHQIFEELGITFVNNKE